MVRIQVCAVHIDGFFERNSLKKGPFSADFRKKLVGYPEVGEK